MPKHAKLKLVNSKTYRLATYTDSAAVKILEWAEKKENAEFFRRCPPICDWISLAAIAQLFGGLWVVYEDAKPIGLAGLFSQDRYSRTADFGLMIDLDDAEDRSSAARAIFNQVCSYVFNYLNFHKIYIRLMPWRDKLAKRIEEHGFTKECDLRDSCYFRGEYHSEMLYSCLKLEFKEVL